MHWRIPGFVRAISLRGILGRLGIHVLTKATSPMFQTVEDAAHGVLELYVRSKVDGELHQLGARLSWSAVTLVAAAGVAHVATVAVADPLAESVVVGGVVAVALTSALRGSWTVVRAIVPDVRLWWPHRSEVSLVEFALRHRIAESIESLRTSGAANSVVAWVWFTVAPLFGRPDSVEKLSAAIAKRHAPVVTTYIRQRAIFVLLPVLLACAYVRWVVLHAL